MSYLCEGGLIIGKSKIEEMCRLNKRLPKYSEYNNLIFNIKDGEYTLTIKLKGDIDKINGKKIILIQSIARNNGKKLIKSMSKAYFMDEFNVYIYDFREKDMI